MQQRTLTIIAGLVIHTLNNNASQLAVQSATVETIGLPVSTEFEFILGLLLGLKRG